jgi:YD repeat-containing protein
MGSEVARKSPINHATSAESALVVHSARWRWLCAQWPDGTIDANNRLTFKDLSDNTYSQDVSYDYDLRGLTLSSRFGSDAGQGIGNTFDGFGRLTAATTNMGGTSRTLNYRYDPNGNRTRITHPDHWFFQYDFDGVNRMDSLSESTAASASAGVTSVLTIDYQSGGGRWHIYRPSGATTTSMQWPRASSRR